jgi:hypothetical protein
MKRTVLIGILCFVVGVAAGAFVVSRALVEPFDLLAWPYANRPVVTTAPLDASADSNVLHLPAGTPLVLQHSAMGQQHFAVLLVGDPDVVYPTVDSEELRKLLLGEPAE